MTVQLKTTSIRKAVNELLSNGSDSAPIVISSRGMVIDQEAGTITLKFKPNKDAAETSSSKKPASKPKTTKPKAKPEATDVPVFARGERAQLKRDYREDIKTGPVGLGLKHFGKVVELSDAPFLIVGFADGKFVCRNLKGRDVKKAVSTVLKAFEGNTSGKKPAKEKAPKAPAKKDSKFELTLTDEKVTSKETKLKVSEKSKLKRLFKRKADKLKKDGVEASWFFKVVNIGRRRVRLLELSVSKKQFKVVNIDTGKVSTIKLSKLLPL